MFNFILIYPIFFLLMKPLICLLLLITFHLDEEPSLDYFVRSILIHFYIDKLKLTILMHITTPLSQYF